MRERESGIHVCVHTKTYMYVDHLRQYGLLVLLWQNVDALSYTARVVKVVHPIRTRVYRMVV